jgi:heme/copper-type cytochrome/quinol oxidase subunit 2
MFNTKLFKKTLLDFASFTDLKYKMSFNVIHNSVLELLWNVLPICCLLIISGPSFFLLYLSEDFSNWVDLTKVIGNQWYWSYEVSFPNFVDEEDTLYWLTDDLVEPVENAECRWIVQIWEAMGYDVDNLKSIIFDDRIENLIEEHLPKEDLPVEDLLEKQPLVTEQPDSTIPRVSETKPIIGEDNDELRNDNEKIDGGDHEQEENNEEVITGDTEEDILWTEDEFFEVYDSMIGAIPNSSYINTFMSYDSIMLDELDILASGYGFRLLEVDNRLYLAFHKTTLILVSSRDVLHSWAVPSLGLKTDACPGRVNKLVVYPNREGVFYGQCSEICGINHAYMPIVCNVYQELDYYPALILEEDPWEEDDADF